MPEINPGENRGLYTVDGDATAGDPVSIGNGLKRGRYEWLKVKFDRTDPLPARLPVVGTMVLDFGDKHSTIDLADGEEVTINQEHDFKGSVAIRTNAAGTFEVTGKEISRRDLPDT